MRIFEAGVSGTSDLIEPWVFLKQYEKSADPERLGWLIKYSNTIPNFRGRRESTPVLAADKLD